MPATDIEKLVVQLSADIKGYQNALNKARGITDKQLRAIEQRAATTRKRIESIGAGIGNSFGRSLASIGAGIGAALSLREVSQAAQQYTKLQNALKVAGLEGEGLEATFGNLFTIAQKNGAALEPLVTLYSRLSQSQKELGASSADLTRFTDGIATALRVGGTTATEASGALLQLSQTLGGAIVRAEEFNSINEGARPILQTVAEGLREAGGSVAKLRSLVLDGKVSSQAFFNAFLAGMPALAEQASKASGTIDQGLSRVGNAFTVVIGKLDETLGASQHAAEGLNVVSDVIQAMPAYIDAAAAGFDRLQKFMASAGNNPIWKKIGSLLGVDYSPQGIAANLGFTPAGQLGGIGSDRTASVPATSGGIGSDRAAGGAAGGVRPVSLTDYPASAAAAEAAAKKEADAYARVVEQLQLEYNQLGLTDDAKEVSNALSQAGVAATSAEGVAIAELVGKLQEKRKAIEDAAHSQEQLNQTMAEFQGIASNALSGFANDLLNGANAAEAAESAIKNLSARLLDMALDAAIQQLFKLLLSSLGGFSLGGSVTPLGTGGIGRAATGGSITGPGTGTSDSIPTMLSNGEFVVRASQAKKYLPLLQAINSGAGHVMKLAAGGSVGRSSSVGGGMPGESPFRVEINNYGAKVTEDRTDPNVLRLQVEAVTNDFLASNRSNPVMRGKFGASPRIARRGTP